MDGWLWTVRSADLIGFEELLLMKHHTKQLIITGLQNLSAVMNRIGREWFAEFKRGLSDEFRDGHCLPL
ncbi:hypothetical protein EVAR_23449_1 [Eumeta japonica]|uniref:Uncharacterized protein n=1 Tax=Eumeta variegata TaxID=151549 RepID=A0A4C1UK29_EUMVA|nr:hypothetical protein EVAR_23449_1 [Eumeta japonica]